MRSWERAQLVARSGTSKQTRRPNIPWCLRPNRTFLYLVLLEIFISQFDPFFLFTTAAYSYKPARARVFFLGLSSHSPGPPIGRSRRPASTPPGSGSGSRGLVGHEAFSSLFPFPVSFFCGDRSHGRGKQRKEWEKREIVGRHQCFTSSHSSVVGQERSRGGCSGRKHKTTHTADCVTARPPPFFILYYGCAHSGLGSRSSHSRPSYLLYLFPLSKQCNGGAMVLYSSASSRIRCDMAYNAAGLFFLFLFYSSQNGLAFIRGGKAIGSKLDDDGLKTEQLVHMDHTKTTHSFHSTACTCLLSPPLPPSFGDLTYTSEGTGDSATKINTLALPP
ncbi:hypothetical protein LZ30DRAFT_311048 [Colletotrichum cereale]|nr:hypothetical protein LZ30DRAFT_311048 [Colletotrichum cereale]